jgi:hypothetical protein
MAIFRSSLVLAALLQAPPPPAAAPAVPPGDSTAVLWARVRTDSLDGSAWLQLARAYLRRSPAGGDTAVSRAALDTADWALARATGLSSGALADSARTFRLFGWGERAVLAWRRGGVDGAAAVWGALPDDARVSPELEELGENLLRACPERGLLITAGDADTYAASYLRFVRGLRSDLTVLPLDVWPPEEVERRLRAAGERQPVCASMAFERAPPRGVRWQARPLVWVGGRLKGTRDRVPPGDFVFAALRLALDESSAWAAPALATYRRAVKHVPALCKSFKTFGIVAEVGCR